MSADYRIVRSAWTETRKAITFGRAPYYTKRRVKGWRVYRGGRAVERFYRKRDAEAWIREAGR